MRSVLVSGGGARNGKRTGRQASAIKVCAVGELNPDLILGRDES